MKSTDSRQAAQARAKQVQKMLDNPGVWKIRVWENMGWHWSLCVGGLSLRESFGSFSCLVSGDPNHHPGGGLAAWTVTSGPRFRNPNRAVSFALANAQAYVDGLQGCISHIQGRLNSKKRRKAS